MALFDVGKARISLKLEQNEKVYECVVKESITITREPNVASKLTCSILRDEITPEMGDWISLTLDEQHHQFKGVIWETSKSGQWCNITAYDQLYYLRQSSTRYSYENLTASELLTRIIKEYGLKAVDPPQIMDTGYVIPYRIEENVPYLDIITTALDLTEKNTGKRFYLWDDAGNVCLWDEETMVNETLRVSLGYIEDYSYSQNMNDLKTKVTLVETVNSENEEEGKEVVYTAIDESMEERYGTIEYFGKVEEKENGDFKAKNLLAQKCLLNEKISIRGCQGDIRVRGGTPIFIDFYSQDRSEYLRGYWRVNSVTHTIKEGHHTMDFDGTLIEMYNDWDDLELGKPHHKLPSPATLAPN